MLEFFFKRLATRARWGDLNPPVKHLAGGGVALQSFVGIDGGQGSWRRGELEKRRAGEDDRRREQRASMAT